MTHSHFCDGSPDEVAEDMKKQLDANPNTIQVNDAVYGVVWCGVTVIVTVSASFN